MDAIYAICCEKNLDMWLAVIDEYCNKIFLGKTYGLIIYLHPHK